MFIAFDLLTFLFWTVVCTLIPGVIIGFSILRRHEFLLIEKIMIGFALGFVLLPMTPFLLFILLGIKYTYTIGVLSVIVLYIVALAFLAWSKVYEDIKLPQLPDASEAILSNKSLIISLFLLLILVLSYLIRIGSYSPIFQELDPYYYTYVAQQVLTQGGNYFNDSTAWFSYGPDNVIVDHRGIPNISYLESVWYSLYTGGAQYNNMMLADIASMYPPIAAVLFVFFVYLFISETSRKEWGLITAAIVSFAPILLYKLSAGEQQVVPYSFFSLAFFLAMYAISMKRKDMLFPLLSGLALLVIIISTTISSLPLVTIMIFIPLESILLFSRDDDENSLLDFFKINAMIFIVGALIGTILNRLIHGDWSTVTSFSLPYFIFLVFNGVLYLVKKTLREQDKAQLIRQGILALSTLFVLVLVGITVYDSMSGKLLFGTDIDVWFKVVALAAFLCVIYLYTLKHSKKNDSLLLIAALIVIGITALATPLGNPVKSIAENNLGRAQYNVPLDRTIAEQGSAGTDFGSQFGYFAEIDQNILNPLNTFFNVNTAQNAFLTLLTGVFTLLLLIPALLVNFVLYAVLSVLNIALGTQVSLNQEPISLMLLWIFIFWAMLAYSLWKFFKKEDNLFVLFFAAVMPPLIVGIIKIKLTEYAGLMLGIAFGFSLEPMVEVISTSYKMLTTKKPEHKKKRVEEPTADITPTVLQYVMAFGVLMVVLQFTYHGFLPSLVIGSLQPLYQNNPAALQPKFQSFCAASNDSDVCAAASNPLGYASQGTNYQYSTKLCELSLFSNYDYLQNPPSPPSMDSWETAAAVFRCQRITDYWMNTMEWIKNNTEPDARFTSWWDYGHWINYFGNRDTVLRNEHASYEQIGAVAYDYLDGTPDELKSWMEEHDSKYAIFDVEIISGGGSLGGKYGALNYLACAYDNQTTVAQSPGESQCEINHLWENVFISGDTCTISSLTNKTGYIGYELSFGGSYTPEYPSSCLNPPDANTAAYCQSALHAQPTYCVGDATLANGQTTTATYYLNETYPNGDLKLNKGFLMFPQQIGNTPLMGQVTQATLLYTEDPVWLENGEVTTGYSDRKGAFYDSNLYRAFFLNDLPGFKLVYTTPDGLVKIYEIQ